AEQNGAVHRYAERNLLVVGAGAPEARVPAGELEVAGGRALVRRVGGATLRHAGRGDAPHQKTLLLAAPGDPGGGGGVPGELIGVREHAVVIEPEGTPRDRLLVVDDDERALRLAPAEAGVVDDLAGGGVERGREVRDRIAVAIAAHGLRDDHGVA